MNNDSPRNRTVGDGYSPPASTSPAAVPRVSVKFNKPKVSTRFKHRVKT